MEKRKPKPVDPVGENVELDEAIIEKLPEGCKVLSVLPSGQSLWVGTVKIRVQLAGGNVFEFFKKGATGDIGANMMNGAYEAEQALYDFLPKQVPKPIAWGTYKNDPDTHFYLCNFVEMYDDLPSARDWTSTVSALHINSMGKSPTGKFGFHVKTHMANVPVDNTWNFSWAAFWAQQMKSLFDQEELLHGQDDEMSGLKKVFFDEIIPGYLGPLQIQPCLIHSDLWPGNIKPMPSTDALCMFDSSAYWGHNEADLGICRNSRYKLGAPAIREYFRRVPASEPVVGFDARNAIYAIKYHALLSVLYAKDLRFRKILIDEMAALISKSASAEGLARSEPPSHLKKRSGTRCQIQGTCELYLGYLFTYFGLRDRLL